MLTVAVLCKRWERESTPPSLANWLIDLARRCSPALAPADAELEGRAA